MKKYIGTKEVSATPAWRVYVNNNINKYCINNPFKK